MCQPRTQALFCAPSCPRGWQGVWPNGGKDSPRCWHRMADRSQIKKRRWRDERDSLRNSRLSVGKIILARWIDIWKFSYYQQCSSIK